MLHGQRFLGPARTLPGYTLYQLDGYPGLVADPDDTVGVSGEIWVVSPACLARLDELECLAVGLYERKPVRLQASAPLGEADTYFYLRSLAGRQRIGGRWRKG